MTLYELSQWLESRDHQVTITLRKEELGLYIKMIDMNTGLIRMGGCIDSESLDHFEEILNKMYNELMDDLGREERNA